MPHVTMIGEVPLLDADGAADDLGAAVGDAFADRVGRVVETYATMFARPEAEVFEAASHFRGVIDGFDADLGIEIRALAAHADVDARWVYALNARSELLSAIGTNECTTLHDLRSGVLAQNWDWEKALHDLLVVERLRSPDGHTRLMLTEPGIIGKIGMSSAGVGVCLNFLRTSVPTLGVPTHVLLRAVLDARSWADTVTLIDRVDDGRSAYLHLAAAGGEGFGIEFNGAGRGIVETGSATAVHTNHYIACEDHTDDSDRENSVIRHDRAHELVDGDRLLTVDEAFRVLSDHTRGDDSILAPFGETDGIGLTGTLATIVMDLPGGAMHVRHGNDAGAAVHRLTAA